MNNHNNNNFLKVIIKLFKKKKFIFSKIRFLKDSILPLSFYLFGFYKILRNRQNTESSKIR